VASSVTGLTGDADGFDLAVRHVTGQTGDVGMVFVGGNLALDFVGTLNERGSTRVENLRTPTDLSAWFVKAGVVHSAPAVEASGLERAVALRESLFRVIAALVDGRAVPRADLTGVNRAAAQPPPTVRVSGTGQLRRAGDLSAALSAVARDALELFDPGDGAILKWCADDACTHPFLDRSRGHRRRWCEMAACGGRAKAAAYRARRRVTSPPA
jgi:predicted RNA-binding Zn ribbon-like protein